MSALCLQVGQRLRSMDEGVNLDAIILDQQEEAPPEHQTLEDRLKEGRGERLSWQP